MEYHIKDKSLIVDKFIGDATMAIFNAPNDLDDYVYKAVKTGMLMQERGEKYKVEHIGDLPEDAQISFYQQGDYIDMCVGPHICYTKALKAFKLTQTSGAYWKNDAKNKMLTRINGVAFATQEELAEYEKMMEEARARDHRKIGKEMSLFMTDDLIGKGLPMFLPKGYTVWQELENYIKDKERKLGYQHVMTPCVGTVDLYKTSGHWDHYKDGMFVMGDEEKDDEVFALRPMTCPFQYYVYKASQKSYRDLPKRYSETSTLFRNEDSGEMHGLTRVRQFTITEGHLIVRPDQMVDEFKKCLALAKHCLTVLGVEEDVTYHLSKWDPADTKKYIGTPEAWNSSEQHIREILTELNINFTALTWHGVPENKMLFPSIKSFFIKEKMPPMSL